MSAAGIYVHIPFCKAKCKYCAFVSTADFSLRERYVDALCAEIRSAANASKVDTIYIGGGTPSCLYRGGLTRIFDALRASFSVDPRAEISVECNPESVDEAFVSECSDCGVNRVSMGLQSANDGVLRAIGRVHGVDDYRRAAELLSRRFDNISSDIILGLPEQSLSDITASVDTVLRYCSHVSVYALTVENGTPLYDSGYSPDDDFVARQYDEAAEKLRRHGLERYEVSNFARRGKQCEHNKKYWSCLPYFGFGVAAHGYDGDRTRYAHSDSLADYLKYSDPEKIALSDKDLYNEYVMLRFRTQEGIDERVFFDRFGFGFAERNKKKLSEYADRGYIVHERGRVAISPRYMFVMNGIIEEFME